MPTLLFKIRGFIAKVRHTGTSTVVFALFCSANPTDVPRACVMRVTVNRAIQLSSHAKSIATTEDIACVATISANGDTRVGT